MQQDTSLLQIWQINPHMCSFQFALCRCAQQLGKIHCTLQGIEDEINTMTNENLYLVLNSLAFISLGLQVRFSIMYYLW